MKINEEIRLSPNEDFETAISRIGVGEEESLRQSVRRQSYLQRFARITSRSNVPLLLNPTVNCSGFSADLEEQMGQSGLVDEDDHTIMVSTTIPPQTQSNLPQRLYDLVFQEFVTTHEIGHLLFSDFERLSEVSDELGKEDYSVFLDLFNPLEDGAIEGELMNLFNIEPEMKIARSNVSVNLKFGIQIADDEFFYTIHDACRTALYDMAAYNSGRTAKILDTNNENHWLDEDDHNTFIDLLDDLKDLTSDFLSTPKGSDRVDLLLEWYKDVYQDIEDEAEVDFKEERHKLRNGSGVGGRGQIQSGDSRDGYIGDEENHLGDGNQTGSMSGQQRGKIRSPTKKDVEEAVRNSEDGTPGSFAGNIEDEQNGDGELSDVEKEVQEKYRQEMRREAREAAGGGLDELEKLHQSIGAADTQLRAITVLPDQPPDYGRWRECEIQGRKLERILREKLRRRNETRTIKNRRRGKFDSRAMTTASRGSNRVFERNNRPQQFDYQFMIVPDRSGSMSGYIPALEEAVGSLSYALNKVGIDTSVIDLNESTPQVALPFGFDPEERSGVITRGDSGGGTPLGDMVLLAKERLEMEADKTPVMVIITDDQPADVKTYKNAVENCNFPVIGVTLGSGGGYGAQYDFSQYFDRHIQVESGDVEELRQKLRMLVEEIVI